MKKFIIFLLFLIAFVTKTNAQSMRAFTPGNFVVLQQSIPTGLTAVNVREYTPAGNLVQSLDLSGASVVSPNNKCYLGGAGSGETEWGHMSRSPNGQWATFGAYGQTSATGLRVGAMLKYDGTVNTATSFTNTTHLPKSVVTLDGTGLWMSSSGLSTTTNNILYLSPLNSSVTPVLLLKDNPNTGFRQLNISGTIYDNSLYVSRSSAVLTYFTGNPTANVSLTATTPPNNTTGTSTTNSRGYCFSTPLSGTAGEVMYVAAGATTSQGSATATLFTPTVSVTSGSNQITFTTAPAATINGFYISAPGVPSGTTISGANGSATTLTLSANATATFSGQPCYSSNYPLVSLGTANVTTGATGISFSTAPPSSVSTYPIIGPGVTSNQTIAGANGSTTSLTLSANASASSTGGYYYAIPTATVTNTVTNASAVITLPINAGFANGNYISGPGIPNGTTIVSGAGTINLTLSQAATSTLTGQSYYSSAATSLGTASVTNGSTSITFATAPAATRNGVYFTGPGIPFGTTLSGANGSATTVTLSKPATATLSGQNYYTSTATTGGIYKYYRTATGVAWTAAGSFGTSANNYLTVTAQPKPGGGFTLYATKYNFSGGSINTTPSADGMPVVVKIEDTTAVNVNMFGVESVIVTGTSNRDVFRGISAAPTVATNLAVYYYKGSGNVDDVTSWTSNYDGTAGTSPANFTANNQVFILKNAATINSFSGSTWAVSGTNSTIYVGDGFNAITFVATNKTVTINGTAISTSNVNNGSTLTTGFSAYYYKGTGNLESLSSWGTVSDGSGIAPTDFTSNSITYYIQNAASATLGGNWVVSGTGSKVVVGDGTSATNFIIPSAYTYTGTINVATNATLTNQNTAFPTIGTFSTGSTVVFNGSSIQTIPTSTAYQNLTVNNTAGAVLAGAITVSGNLTLQAGTLADMGNTLTLRGNIYGAGTHTSGGFKMSGVSFGAGVTSFVLPSVPSYVSINTPIYAAGFDKSTRVTAYNPATRTISFTPATLSAGSNVTLFNIPGNGTLTALGAYTWTSGNTVTLSATPATSSAVVIGYPITAASGIPAGTVITGYDGATTLTLSQTPTASGTFTKQTVGEIAAKNATVTAATNITLGDASGTLTLGNISIGDSTALAGVTTVTLGNTVDVNGVLTFLFNNTTTTTSTANYIDLNEKTLNCHSIISPKVQGGWIVLGGSNSSTTSSLNLYTARFVNQGLLTLRMDATKKYLNNFVSSAYNTGNSTSQVTIGSDIVVKNFALGSTTVIVNKGIQGQSASFTILNSFTRVHPVNYGSLVAGGSNTITFSNSGSLTLPSINPFGSEFAQFSNIVNGSTVTLASPNLSIQAGMTIGNGNSPIEAGTTIAAYDGNLTITLSKPALANVLTAAQTLFIGSPYTSNNNAVSISDIVINGGGALNFGSNISFGGSIDISNNSSLNIGAYTANFYTDRITIASGSSLNANSTSSILLGGTASNLNLPSNITALKNLTLNNNNGTTLAASITLGGTLSLLNGTLRNSVSNNITLANATTVNISGGKMSVAPIFGSTVNVEYRANSQATPTDPAPDPVAYTTGNEIPVSTSVLNNLTFNAYSLTDFQVTNAGSGYTTPPSVTIGNAWAANTGYIVGKQVTNGGNLYTCTTAGTSSTSTLGTGPLDYGNGLTDGGVLWDYVGVAPKAYAKLNGATLGSIVMTVNGTGYTSAPTITIGAPSSGTTATVTAVMSSPTVTLASNANINGTLNLQNGKLLLSFFNLTTSSSAGAITGANANSYILTDTTGKLVRTNVPLSTATAFPMGIVGSYTPLTITNTAGATSTMSVGARRYFNHSMGDSTQALFLQWSVLGSVQTTSSITYQFNTNDKAPDFSFDSTCELGTYKTGWAVTPVGTPTSIGGNAYTVSATGLVVPTTGENFYVIANTGNVLLTQTTWTGAVSTDWSNAANWTNTTLPSSTLDVVIPVTSRKPLLTTTSTVKNLTLQSGVILTITSPGVVQILRDFTNNGTVKGTGTVSIKGTAAQAIYGTGFVNNLTLNNSTGATISNIGTNKVNVTGLLTITSGTLTTTTNGNLTLKSISIDSSATVAPLVGSIAGSNVTVERFIPMGLRAYRDISPSVTTTTSIFTNWQEGGLSQGAAQAGYGTYITGAVGSSAGQNGSGFDYSYSGSPSLLKYVSGSWTTPVANTNATTLSATQPYRILIRGDRRFNIFTAPQGGGSDPRNGPGPMQSPTTLRATGTLYSGNYSPALNSTTGGFTMVANPYVCPINWNTVTKSNIGTSYWYLDPTIGNANKYVVYNTTVGGTNNPFYSDSSNYSSGAATGSQVNQYIQPGQAFFVKTMASSPSLTIAEANKAAGTTKIAVFDVAEPVSKIAVGLLKQSTTSTAYRNMDGAVVAFGNNFGNGIGDEDSYKINGASDNLAIVSDSLLSIEGRQPVTEKDTIALLATGLDKTLGYRLRIDASSYAGNGVAPYLYDSYKNTVTALDVTKVNTIDFAVDANAASSGQRFSLVFKPTVLAVNSIVVAAKATANGVQVNWNTVGEHGAISYEVERSTNGISFSKQSTVAAKNTATASYSFTDGKPTSGDNYYRIKAIGTTGVNYSQVVLVKVGVSAALVSVYPNPFSGNKLVVNLSSVVSGNYRVRLHNSLGQQIVSQLVKSGAEAVVTVGTLAAGNYQVSVSDANGNPIYQTKLVAAK